MLRAYRQVHRRGSQRAALGLAAGTLLSVVASRPARAEVTVDYESGSGACQEAAGYFPEDDSVEATRARQRCRLDTFAERSENDRVQKEMQAQNDREKLVQTWIDKQNIPARVFRRIWLDGYLGGGITTYGLAAGVVILPWLEAELSLGRRDLNGLINNGDAYFQDSRTCWGGRFKGLMRSHGNVTPFASAGVFFCDANAALTTYGTGIVAPGGTFNPGGTSNGSAGAHLLAGGAGVTWTDNSGLHASLEYIFTYAFYSQAVLADMNHTEDTNLTSAWTDRLGTERNGFRVQVGYAF